MQLIMEFPSKVVKFFILKKSPAKYYSFTPMPYADFEVLAFDASFLNIMEFSVFTFVKSSSSYKHYNI